MLSLPWKSLTLFHPDTKKTWNIEYEGNTIRTCLNNGAVKEKIEERIVDKTIQTVMAQLRKGFIYTNPSAAFGQPLIHRYIVYRQAYTGSMPVAAHPDKEDFYLLRIVGQFEDEILFHYNKEGEVLSQIHLGAKRLTFRATLDADGTLFFDNNHKMEHFDPDTAQFIPMENDTPKEEIGIQIASGAAFRADFRKGNGNIELWDLQTETLRTKLLNEFTVHNVNCAFTKSNLIVHTDYGVLSIYNMKQL